MTTLYNKDQCPFCWKVRQALHHLQLPHRLIDYQDRAFEQQWRQLSPEGTVPVMTVHDPEQGQQLVFTESADILEYLQERFGGLLPDSAVNRAKARALAHYSDTVLGWGLREVIFEKRSKPEHEWDRCRIENGIVHFNQCLEYLSQQLAEQSYFAGQYSFADAAISARFGLAQAYGVELPKPYDNLIAWFERIRQSEAYQESAPEIELHPI